MTHSSKKEKLTLNVSPVQCEDADVRIGFLDYHQDDRSQLQKLRAAYGNTHVFLRDGERVLCVPFTSEAGDVGWCPSIACMKGLRRDCGRSLIKLIAKVRGHPVAQQLLHGPHVVRYPCRHRRGDGFPLLG